MIVACDASREWRHCSRWARARAHANRHVAEAALETEATLKDATDASSAPSAVEVSGDETGSGVVAGVTGEPSSTEAAGAAANDFGDFGEFGGDAASADDDTVDGAWVNYSTGPVSVGYRLSSIQSGTAGTAGKEVEAYAIAFNVNDNMSVSVATQDIEFDVPSGTNTTETINAFNASYTMGAASVRGTVSEASDDAGVSGSDDEHMEISLVLSF